MNYNRNNQMRSAVLLLMATSGCLVSCQFLPQSHLGRLVQSITSPLVISSQAGYRSNDDPDSASDGASAGYYQGSSGDPSEESGTHLSAGSGRQQAGATGLQQAPSQQRGVPTQQHYFNEDDQGSAPSNNKHTQDYQMGAYLGPSMDDKEINGAFNSQDDRDEDDGPASYDGPSSAPAMGRGRAAASHNTYHNNEGHQAPGSGYGRGQAGANYGSSAYDEDGADEDDAPVPRARHQHQGRSSASYGRSGLSQAASQYQQRGTSGQAPGHSLMAAANGYAPYGYGTGPVDLNGLMAGVNGDPSAGYQVYQGDGSYPGANYYQQQAQAGRNQRPASRSQAASLSNGYYNTNANANGFAPPSSARDNSDQANNYNNEDRDIDNDED